MQVFIPKVLNKGGLTLPRGGRRFMLNLQRVTLPVAITETETTIFFRPDTRVGGAPQKWTVEGAYPGIASSVNTQYIPGLTYNVLVEKWGKNVINTNRILQVDQISYAFSDLDTPTKTVIFYEDTNSLDLTKVLVNVTLDALADIINFSLAPAPSVTTATFGACTNFSQAVNFTGAQASWIYYLEKYNGFAWVPLAQATGLSGTTSNTYNTNAGDLVLNDQIRVRGQDSDSDHSVVLVEGAFACTGTSASGSGAGSGDCSLYAYFDGIGWNNTFKTFNFGATCVLGYFLEIATDQQFVNMVHTEQTEATVLQVTGLPSGTYYARVRNVANTTRFSQTLTFVVS